MTREDRLNDVMEKVEELRNAVHLGETIDTRVEELVEAWDRTRSEWGWEGS